MTIALIALTAMTACTSIDCPVENNVATLYKLQKADGTQDTLHDTLTVLTRLARGVDTVILNKSVETTSFQLPISYTNAADTFTFVRKSDTRELTDTVWIEKTNLPQFESVDCKLVNAGGDADTNAAVACAILGAKYGFDSIPTEYVEGLIYRDKLEDVTRGLNNIFRAS